MFVDSHCHIDFPELAQRLPQLLENMKTNQVTHALCISVTLEDFPDRKSTRLNSSHVKRSRMPSSA